MTATVLVFLVGAMLVVVALVDMLWTTVAASAGGGPITSHVSKSLWDGARWFACRGDEVRHGPLRVASVVIIVVVFSVWLTLAWAGWTLVLLADPDAVVAASTGASTSVTERAYFAGYTMGTLGNGEFIPNGTVWQAVTVLATLTGFGMATMGITYLVPVVGAVTDRRARALHIASLGRNPEDIVVQAWQGNDWRALEHELQQIGPTLSLLGQRHLAYPVLHFFHDVDVDAAAAVRIAVLDEAVTLLECAVEPEARPRGSVLGSTRRSINAYLGALRAAYIAPAAEDPPLPDVAALRDAGIPTVGDEEFERAVGALSERRRTLWGAVQDDGWTWDRVRAPSATDGDTQQGIDVDDFQDHADGGTD